MTSKNLLEADSMELFALLPTYEITSKAQTFTLNDCDIDENMINNINSKYHSVQEFKSAIQEKSSFSIMHSNLNGLESKIDDLSCFISTISNKLDIICISETSQKADIDFSVNVKLPGYKYPYSLGSHSARGGVAIYVNDKLDVIVRNDLSKNTNSFEAIWIEMIQKKIKKCPLLLHI